MPSDVDQMSAVLISIHAPAGGATYPVRPAGAVPLYFNSRPCGRGDALDEITTAANGVFQFTPLREGRP